MEEPRLLIITGMSGAGKTETIRTLEDLNYFCVDNMPPAMIPKFAELSKQVSAPTNVAVIADIRGGRFFDQLIEVLAELRKANFAYEVLFLDASDEVLIRRYKETRRRHPLKQGRTLSENIAEERERLAKVRSRATYVIDTSNLKTGILKNKLRELFAGRNSAEDILVSVQSFGFKHGLPLDSDMVLDVRFLTNPFYEKELRLLTGNDEQVAKFLENIPETEEFLQKETALLEWLLPKYVAEGKSQLVISVGCTGGQHRSVYVANRLAEFLEKLEYKVLLSHRDLPLAGK